VHLGEVLHQPPDLGDAGQEDKGRAMWPSTHVVFGVEVAQ
jgi:hypothetical protein